MADIGRYAVGHENIPDDWEGLFVRLIDGGAEVVTPLAVFRAPQVVVTAGAWLGKLVPGLRRRAGPDA